MKKLKTLITKVLSITLIVGSLCGGVLASAGSLYKYGNAQTYRLVYYNYAYTGAYSSWAATTMYKDQYEYTSYGTYRYIGRTSFGYKYDSSGYAQTPTYPAGPYGIPVYSTHSCNLYTASKFF